MHGDVVNDFLFAVRTSQLAVVSSRVSQKSLVEGQGGMVADNGAILVQPDNRCRWVVGTAFQCKRVTNGDVVVARD